MDHLKWSNGVLESDEDPVHEQTAVSVYVQTEKTAFENGRLQLTSHRLIWFDKNDRLCVIDMRLAQIAGTELINAQQVARNVFIGPKLLIRLDKQQRPQSGAISPPLNAVEAPIVQFEFNYGGHNEFSAQLKQQLARKKWTYVNTDDGGGGGAGIGSIQSKMQEKLDKQDQQIHESFKDLNVLMNQAKEMVNLSNVITAKIAAKEKASAAQTDENSEEMKKLKSYFLNMGLIDNPVTKEESGSSYHKDLAKEIYASMTQMVVEQGGVMSLADVYCRLNRARGIAGLVSPDDLLHACKYLNKLNLKLKYAYNQSLNLHLLEVAELERERVDKTFSLVVASERDGLSPYALSQTLKCSLLVAKKQLLDAERLGKLCRDDTNSGLKFFRIISFWDHRHLRSHNNNNNNDRHRCRLCLDLPASLLRLFKYIYCRIYLFKFKFKKKLKTNSFDTNKNFHIISQQIAILITITGVCFGCSSAMQCT